MQKHVKRYMPKPTLIGQRECTSIKPETLGAVLRGQARQAGQQAVAAGAVLQAVVAQQRGRMEQGPQQARVVALAAHQHVDLQPPTHCLNPESFSTPAAKPMILCRKMGHWQKCCFDA